MAEWAAYKATGTSYDQVDGSILDYILHPGTPLFQRVYDAVGFFGHVDDTTGNFFSRAAATFRADGVTAVAAAGGNAEASLST